MGPSAAAAALRAMADGIDRSVRPSSGRVAADLRKILASLTSKAYRVITDEPQGLAVGFKPSDAALAQIGAEVDEWDVVSDDGTDGTPWLIDGVGVEIKDLDVSDGVSKGMSPLGMDMAIWRSEQEMLAWFSG